MFTYDHKAHLECRYLFYFEETICIWNFTYYFNI